MSESVLAQIAALKAKSTAELRHMWRELFDREPPVLGRRYLEDRIAYRVQELHFGGLSDRARRKLDALADQLEPKAARRRAPGRPIAGTQLRRHWKNVEHVVTVREHDFEYEGPPLPIVVGGRQGDCRNEVERLAVLRPQAERDGPVSQPPCKVRCAVYCRKSSEEGLGLSFNSLDAQRQACISYIQSQCHEGWAAVDDRYDDGGYSGGTLERPALQRLIGDIEAGRIDAVICYRIDRLSRSLADFTKLVDVFENNKTPLVSITENFNTGTSIGRLNLHMILSFAQYERELAGERNRDKFLQSRKRGLWMGGHAPLGYDVRDRKLVINETEATLVRHIFERFLQGGSATTLVQELNAAAPSAASRSTRASSTSCSTTGPMSARSSTRAPPTRVSTRLSSTGTPGPRCTRSAPKMPTAVPVDARGNPAPLKGLIFGPDDRAMAPSHTRRRGRLYRFYRTATSLKLGHGECPVRAVPAGEVEAAVVNQVRALLRAPEIVVRVWRAAQLDGEEIDEREVVEALQRLDPLWDQLFPAEQARILQLLVARVVVRLDGLEVSLRVEGIGSLVDELRLHDSAERQAA
jgi:site-specific DNA recombinase